MKKLAVEINKVSKWYFDKNNRIKKLSNLLWNSNSSFKKKSILKNINFKIYSGDSVAIIGANGAGKSTLLKLIANVTQPSCGSIKSFGKVHSLLELGLGFNPEFTGKENIFMSALMVGYQPDEINSLINNIIEFADIGKYIDEPIKYYSTGMQMRLAFSVATMVKPDILLVDEALSVGDFHFQQKSFNKIKEFVKAGTTLLLASHDKNAILNLCNKAILLNNGKIINEGKPSVVLDYYEALSSKSPKNNIKQNPIIDGSIRTYSGDNSIDAINISILNINNKKIKKIFIGQKIKLKIIFKVIKNINDLTVGFSIKNRLGVVVYGTNSAFQNYKITDINKNNKIEILFEFAIPFAVGIYNISLGFHQGDNHVNYDSYKWIDNAFDFEVCNSSSAPICDGIVWIPVRISSKQLR